MSGDDELTEFLQGRIPSPRADYWQEIDRRLDAAGSNTAEDELGDFLRSSIPTATPGYWQQTDQRLAGIAGERDGSDSLDTDHDVVRPMVMDTKPENAQRPNRSIIFAAAAAMILIAGLAMFATLRGRSDGGSVDLATQIESPQTGAAAQPAQPAQAAGGDNPGDPTLATAAGPLTTMQLQLLSNDGSTDTLFCFAARGVLITPTSDVVPEFAAVQLAIQPNGSYSLLALQNDFYLMSAAGEGGQNGMFDTAPQGIANLSTALPPTIITLTDSTITFGSRSTLPLVSCTDIEPQIQIMKDSIAAMQDQAGAEIPVIGPLTALRDRIDPDTLSEQSDPYCFRGLDEQILVEASSTGPVVLEMTIGSFGAVNMLALQTNGGVLTASGDGNAAGQFTSWLTLFDSTSMTIDTEWPRVQVTLTEQTVTVGTATLDLVPCGDVAGLIQTARSVVDAANQPQFDGPDQGPELAPISNDEVLSSGGLGPVRIGMLLSELETTLGVDLEFDTLGLNEPGSCGYVWSNIDRDVSVIVETTGTGGADSDAIVQRVSTRSDRWGTPSGIRVGMTDQQVRDNFDDQLTSEPHVYVEDGEYLTFVPSDPNDPNTVQFVIEFGVVAEIRAGADPWVGLVEGCA